jgi:hypothetical protein
MVGHKLGEFAPTRTFKSHGGDRKSRAEAAGGVNDARNDNAMEVAKLKNARISPQKCRLVADVVRGASRSARRSRS